MCIICIKPAGTPMPNGGTIATMWQANSDGAGLAYWRNNENAVHIDKGFMKLKALRAKLNEINLGINDMAILHFRWATHGLTDEGNCHPFPLSSKIDALRALSGVFPTAIAHNGVFGSMPNHDTLSDTQKFIAKIMCNPAIVGNLDNPAIRELIKGYCGSSSKLSILRPGKITLIGEFEKDDITGLMYSNGGYKTRSYSCGGTWKGHNCDDDYTPPQTPSMGITDKLCELCQEKEHVEYVEEYQLFLCLKCFNFNRAIDMARIEKISEQDALDMLDQYNAEEAELAEQGHAND